MAKKAPEAAGQCLIHFKGEGKGALTWFRETSFKKVLISLWLSLDGEQQEIATKSSSILKNIQSTEESSLMIQGLYYKTAMQNLQTLPTSSMLRQGVRIAKRMEMTRTF